MVEATIEDLAFTIRSSRVSDGGRRRGCIEHDLAKGYEKRANTEIRILPAFENDFKESDGFIRKGVIV
jgi:hypothetical protein